MLRPSDMPGVFITGIGLQVFLYWDAHPRAAGADGPWPVPPEAKLITAQRHQRAVRRYADAWFLARGGEFECDAACNHHRTQPTRNSLRADRGQTIGA